MGGNQSNIPKIAIIDDENESWIYDVPQNEPIDVDEIIIKKRETNLEFISSCKAIRQCNLLYLWRNLQSIAPDMSRCKVDWLWTSVSTVKALPKTLELLNLGLLVDQATGMAQDPGLAFLIKHCPRLYHLGVHVNVWSSVGHLPSLPDTISPYMGVETSGTILYLPNLLNDSDLLWAVNTAVKLQPTKRGYGRLILPSCGLNVNQLCELMYRLSAAGVTVSKEWYELLRKARAKGVTVTDDVMMRCRGNIIVDGLMPVMISSRHTDQEKQQLEKSARSNLLCKIYWAQDDDELSLWDAPGW